MDFANPLFELVKELWGLASKPLSYIYNLKDNVDSLQNKTEDLKVASEDVKAKVESEEKDRDAQRTKQVVNWLGKVQEFAGRVDQVLREVGEHDQIKCISRCLPRNCRLSYKLGKRVHQMLNEARELKQKKGEFGDFTSPLPPPQVLEMPMDKTVGLDIFKLHKVWKWLVHEKQVGVIGLYGVGGVGKTTLMNRINQELSRTNHGFDVVIWVVVSKQVNEDGIQDAIRKRLDIKDDLWNGWSWHERVHHLWEDLTRKKYVLLIDDLWERLDLSKIGVPRSGLEDGSKIVFTTRSKQVCDQMAPDKTFEVQCLTPEEAQELFENSVGNLTVHSPPEILELAKDIVGECKGLPLALITVGRAMAGRRKSPHVWKHALTTLRNNPHKLSGMEEMYHILEFSYSSLNDSTLQLCFLYCCLFPEDYHIRPHNLIELWIGEGLLEDTNDIYNMRDNGEYVLDSLKMACLLESGCDDYGNQYVKMHDVIRDMATWIARDHGQSANKLLVIEKEEDMSAEMISKWGEAVKVSLWGKCIRNIGQTRPRSSQLETLFVRETELMFVPREFFDSMIACLTVLDLSDNTCIESFPEGICNLINLLYLNLSRTGVRELPREIKNLTRLRWLLLEETGDNILIPTRAMTSLPLNAFSNWSSKLMFCRVGHEKEEEMVEELGCMPHLTYLSIEVFKSSSALKIFQSPNLQRRIRRLRIGDMKRGLTHIVISDSSFSHLEALYVQDCSVLVKIEITQGIGRAPSSSCFPSLVDVWIVACGLLDLSWLVHAPKLRVLAVEMCDSMEKIIGNGFAPEQVAASRPFSHLESLTLGDLPELTSICDQTLFFPQGLFFRISNCPRLRKLPLDTNVARGSFSVDGDADWWAEFEWDPAAQVTVQFRGQARSWERLLYGSKQETTFGEAVCWIKDGHFGGAKIGFGPMK